MLKKIEHRDIWKEDEANELNSLLEHLKSRDLPTSTIDFVNTKVEVFNEFSGTPGAVKKELSRTKTDLLKFLEKEHELVPEKYYTTYWMTLGMSAFGLPFGVVLYAITNNPAFIALGLPIGLAIGSQYGARLDKKAAETGKVLKF
ncbi:hypothetical protein [Salinimicrobium oceani]|uniref:Uncharacterized protein n=1 Tax=Salinimicrobium oceani TaxID=2722702 RepID=A0ABX1CZK9_9FLAO|nr:hypothetical protein [Salinimicrobium oceani]NJW52814.1 hypothetical protein [Salinimicrobium oceani]